MSETACHVTNITINEFGLWYDNVRLNLTYNTWFRNSLCDKKDVN